jgi:hypothetical protein
MISYPKIKSLLGFSTSKSSTEIVSELVNKYAFPQSRDAREDIQRKYGSNGDLIDLFTNNKGPIVHKWHHYIPIYEKYFSQFKNTEFKFLEIGVDRGGSLQMWRKYFGQKAKIYGIDINPECMEFNGVAGQVRIGSQSDFGFLESVVNEMGGVDVILDDGSHQMKHIKNSLKYLFPRLSYGGIYLIEDLHTAYWSQWGGGVKSNENFFNYVRNICDDMHRWYHGEKLKYESWTTECSALHIHDSVVILEKNKVYRPTHSQIGNGLLYK